MYMPDINRQTTTHNRRGRTVYTREPAQFSFLALLGLGGEATKEAFIPTYSDSVTNLVAPIVKGNAPDRATKAGKKMGRATSMGGVMSSVKKNLPLIGVGVTLLAITVTVVAMNKK